MNTKEENSKAVIAELQKICPEPATEIVSDGMKIECEMIGNHKRWLFRWVDKFGRTGGQIVCIGENVQFYSDEAFMNASRLLGLSQAAEIKRLKAVLMTIRLDALDKRSRHEGLNTNETLHTINNALKPQEREV